MSSNATRWTLRVAIGLVLIAGIGWYLHSRSNTASATTTDPRSGSGAPGEKRGGAGGGSAARVVPVQVATAEKKDFPVWLEGLGLVAAYQQVTVHTQVDGRLDAVKFTEGQKVKKGDVIAQIDPRPFMVMLHNAQGALARDQAQVVAAKADYDRQKNMHDQNLVAQNAVDASLGTLGNYQGAVKIDQAAIESAQLNLDYAAIKAPLDGITGVRLVDAGNIVHAADTTGLVVITAIDPAAVIFTLPQDRLTDVTAALAAGTVEVDVYNRDGSQILGKGSLAVLDNQVNVATATMKLKAIIPNENHVLWPNAYVKTRALVSTKKDAVVIPAAAVQQGPTGAFVYVVGADQAVTMTPVTVSLTQGETSVVDKGLAGGEVVVTEGANQLRNGGKVDTGQGKKSDQRAMPPGIASPQSDKTSRGHKGSGSLRPDEAAKPPKSE